MSLSIVIPSDSDLVYQRPFVRINREECPVKSDAAGWYSMIYHKWTVDQIQYDLIYRIRDLNVDYDCAITDEEFDEKVEQDAIEAESIIRSEFQKLITHLTRGMVEEVIEQLDALQLTKVQYKAAKIGIRLSDLMSVIDINSMPSESKSSNTPSTPKVN